MLEDLLKTFTDRREAIALFERIRHRDPHQFCWPLLPILTFIAPGGSGKSTLIEYLISGRCYNNGKAILPYAHIDFTRQLYLREMLSILIELRDQLQSHADEHANSLTFPRFDLGAAIAMKAPLGSNLPSLGRDEIRRELQFARSAFQSLNEMGNALGNIYPYIPPLLVGLKWLGQTATKIPALREALLQIEYQSNWKWYLTPGADIGFGTTAELSQVLLRLHALSISSRIEKEGRDHLVNHVLPAAFIADLRDALDGSSHPRTWNVTTNIVLFLDGFEALLESSAVTAIHLLEVLALSKHRREGETDPLLLVLGSKRRPLQHTNDEQQPSLAQQTQIQDDFEAKEYANGRYGQWLQQLPPSRRRLRLNDLYLPLWLYDFGREDTHSYLSLLNSLESTHIFSDLTLVDAIHRATHGHPLYLALAAATVLEAEPGKLPGLLRAFEQAPVPVTPYVEQVSGHQDEVVGDYLLSLFLSQLSEAERDELIFCAVPRMLDTTTIKAVLQLSRDLDAQKKFDRYRLFTFVTVRSIDNKVILHPVVRGLLLQRLRPDRNSDSDYQRTHQLLRVHFHIYASRGEQQAAVEEAYHALALGDPEPAIRLGILVQRINLETWELLLEAVAQAPTDLMSADIEQQAYTSLAQANQYHEVEDVVTALILYSWLLSASQSVPRKAAEIQHNLGLAYRELPAGDRQENLRRAIACYEAAVQVHTREAFPVEWAMTQNNLGLAYRELPAGDRQENLDRAIACYDAALQVYTREAFPVQWAGTQNNLGLAYKDLSAGDQQENLRRAITYFEAALQVRTREALPVDWAMTQNNLGTAYKSLSAGDQEEDLRRAIVCYEAALQVHTREAFPVQWAMTQYNLGTAYRELPAGDRQENLDRAIACYDAALQVYTREAFPVQWAMTQNNLGTAYKNLPAGDQQENLRRAIVCYEATLQVRTREALPVDWARTQNNLGIAYQNLPAGDRQENLRRGIACYDAALQVYTREAFPVQWATTQINLGTAYRELPAGDRQENLRRAIACYEAALQVYTREAFPVQWAMTQINLGNAYWSLPVGDRQENLRRAIAYYDAALHICRLLHLDYYAQVISGNFEIARDELRGLDQH